METSRRSVDCFPCRPLNCSCNFFHNTALKPSNTHPWMPVCVQPTTKMKSKYCLFAGCESGKKFGIIGQLCEQPYTSKGFQWTAPPHVFKKKN